MEVRTLLLVVLFTSILLNSTMADWDPKSALILVTLSSDYVKIFPLTVRKSRHNNRSTVTVYHNEDNTGVLTYGFCPCEEPEHAGWNCAKVTDIYGRLDELQLLEKCDAPVVYELTTEKDTINDRPETCRHNNIVGFLYRFNYNVYLPDPKTADTIFVYDVCYERAQGGVMTQMLLANITIGNPSLLNNALLKDERNFQFELDEEHYIDSFSQYLVDYSSRAYSRRSEYSPTLVLPDVLAPYAHQRKPLHNFMNVAPMLNTLKGGWEVFLDNLRLKLSNVHQPTHVSAGLLGKMSDDQNNNLYLYHLRGVGGYFTIPKTFWIMIYNQYRTKGIVIIMHNINYSTARINPKDFFNEPYCNRHYCDEANLTNALPDARSPLYINCCISHVITSRFGFVVSNDIFTFP